MSKGHRRSVWFSDDLAAALDHLAAKRTEEVAQMVTLAVGGRPTAKRAGAPTITGADVVRQLVTQACVDAGLDPEKRAEWDQADEQRTAA